MARWAKDKKKPSNEARPITGGVVVASEAEVAVAVARTATKPLPTPDPSQAERWERLRKLKVGADDPEVARAAVEAAARLRCLVPFTRSATDRTAAGELARLLVWASFEGVVDPYRALTRSTVEQYLTTHAPRREGGWGSRRSVLYAVGRVLHPQHYPPVRGATASRQMRQTATTPQEIANLRAVIPGLPDSLGTRVQLALDLCYGAGARSADLRDLRGTAITSVTSHGEAFTVVTMPSQRGGVRQVPVIDPDIGARLLVVAARVGDGLVLAPNAKTAERNIVNRISEELRKYGYPGINPVALRNRWVLDLAERIPAALLLQLADVLDLKILTDQRGSLPRYKIRHILTILRDGAR